MVAMHDLAQKEMQLIESGFKIKSNDGDKTKK